MLRAAWRRHHRRRPGVDRVNYTPNGRAMVVVDVDRTAANDGEPGEGNRVGADVGQIMGDSGNDILVGNSSANWIDGYLGADQIYGLDGDDTLPGDADDQVYGGNGADNLDGGSVSTTTAWPDRAGSPRSTASEPVSPAAPRPATAPDVAPPHWRRPASARRTAGCSRGVRRRRYRPARPRSRGRTPGL
jgi:hypothetical protein